MYKLLIIILILIGFSCDVWIPPRNLTDDAFYSLTDASVRLVVKYKEDTLIRSDYEKINGLPGKYFKLLSTTDKIDTSLPLGIQIKLWAKIVLNKEGTYYGWYPKNGLLEKVDTLTVRFVHGDKVLDITPLLKGDSSINEIKWRKCDHKMSSGRYIYGQCTYFKDINSFINTLNTKADTLRDLTQHDYIFWLDKDLVSKLTFKPGKLQMNITLVDTTGVMRRQITDFIIIN